MSDTTTYIGTPRSRVDGQAKVCGTARYAGEFGIDGLLHGYVVSSSVARGRIVAIDAQAAEAMPGVVKVFTHANRPEVAGTDAAFQDEVHPPGSPFRPFFNDRILYSGQPVALVVGESFEAARDGASLIRVSYDQEPHETDVKRRRGEAYDPPEKRNGIPPPPPPKGDVDGALATAAARIEHEYRISSEHHNPMEPHATTVFWDGGGAITVHDKIQGVLNSQTYITNVFGLPADKVRVLSPYVGGAFGSGLRPQYQLFLAVMAALELQRSVRVVLTRDQMFTFGYRPETINTVTLGADASGKLQALRHEAIAATSTFEDYQEPVVNWSGMLYACDNVELGYRIAKVDTYTPADMRAPGAPLGLFALESAMDELAYALGMDPLELRLVNYAERDGNEGKPFASKALREAYRLGAERFGWSRRQAEPRSMRAGRELIGWGMASGAWEAMMMPTTARAVLTADGKLEVGTASADIGTGTYTILTQIAADALGLPMSDVTAHLGDSKLPKSPVEGGSWGAASAGNAVRVVCEKLRATLLDMARSAEHSPLANVPVERIVVRGGRIERADDASRFVAIADALRGAGIDRIEEEETSEPDAEAQEKLASYTHSAVFAEVRVDEDLGVIRVTRVVDAVAAGRILNPKTARSQIIGGVTFGIGMALAEESMTDHTFGRFMNHNLAEYHIPVNADIHDIEVVFVDETDTTNALGVKGLGEIGVVGTAAAIANAIYHATGKRVRDLPITIDRLL
ncbi:xanthine dehydrogenase family protein molybdopterin-binding subunit [Marinivivus vitaminiproducens]|uniref:xanthine dehydrogenase family protein molybdopterin-binding subunit n=1 Tax=Marinivivus vitaminiproducens TaxID=3035935 RepID=UPI0027A68489|nr:xanthine dehydrogenase family protein molybdopterin-binding subunit [Geminicoccaceae bacterium SCSIO 64248]